MVTLIPPNLSGNNSLNEQDGAEPPSPPHDSDDDLMVYDNGQSDNNRNEQTWNGPMGWKIYFPGTNENDEECKGKRDVVKKTMFYIYK